MTVKDFLLELGTEEIPARFMPGIIADCKQKTENWLNELNIPYREIAVYGTPRRIVIYVHELSEKQQDKTIEARGPAKKAAYDDAGNLTKAGLGFAKGQGVDASQLETRATENGEYIFAVKKIAGGKTIDILSGIKDVILNISFPKNMRWGNHDLRFVRPIQWLLCMYGNEVIPFSIANKETSNISFGHRFLSETPLQINSPDMYFEVLRKNYVIVDQTQRQQDIIAELKRIEKEHNVTIPIDSDLLEEVTYLVEFPTAIIGSFEEEYLQIPKEVLITSMKEHQRYFPVMDSQGTLLAHFVTIKNGDNRAVETIKKGNEKVLRARLADARFFYEEDKKVAIDSFNKKLTAIVYQEELGTITDKLHRIKENADEITKHMLLTADDEKNLARTIEICKFDLVTNMVYEFPELQGLMGREYALLAGERAEVADAIFEHYLPRFAGDEIPKSIVGSIVSVADKIDTIVSCFGIGIIPTGSQDPYALRRQATGICQIIKGNQLELPLNTLVDIALTTNAQKDLLKKPKTELVKSIMDFFMLRVKNILQDEGVRYDCIEACLDMETGNILDIIAKGHALQKALELESFSGIIETCNRVRNIAAKFEGKSEYNIELFIEPIEKELYDIYQTNKKRIEESVRARNYQEVIQIIGQLKPEIDRYFDNVMVMDKDDKIKNNRLAFLSELNNTLSVIGDTSKIINK
ncbi:glycine--tRNA ligase subunit beta [Desulfuribacillus alkaliarsenatis]|uniref:Glycine--tRNA ligase beta subunit n=1 Tax=Desulfuribacillus alkaliarsenatis TaxID=766136 RepID=A0A1E5G046_9FIRM|nr:glycine--tRNA ligase subunit beta [Desulfuribacillus alkaliarsenatis]OEF96215.1 glycine--tRNA ligase subunit beta [Desulfuribacillus alkaliarsenatis]